MSRNIITVKIISRCLTKYWLKIANCSKKSFVTISMSMILANKRIGTLYIGLTNDLFTRSFQYKLKQDPDSFTAKYNIDKLVYFEEYQYIQDAILREKQLKKWNRQGKIRLIEKDNPAWRDLFLARL